METSEKKLTEKSNFYEHTDEQNKRMSRICRYLKLSAKYLQEPFLFLPALGT